MNRRYIFLDTWVFSLLSNPVSADALAQFVHAGGFTVIITGALLIELYNPSWQNATSLERGELATTFIARSPSVIIDPAEIWDRELDANLSPLPTLPVKLDLKDLSAEHRKITLLALLRRDPLFLNQGQDIEEWRRETAELKGGWLQTVERIIDHACRADRLRRDASGSFIDKEALREIFLISLDLRRAKREMIDSILANAKPKLLQATAVRTSSLCFWYLYIDIDPANRPKHRGSDIVDIFHASLLPYCRVLTIDQSMHRTLLRTGALALFPNCRLLTKADLEQLLRDRGRRDSFLAGIA